MRKFIIGVLAEVKKVKWPTPKEMAGLVVFTIAVCGIIAVLMLGLDVFFIEVRNLLLDI